MNGDRVPIDQRNADNAADIAEGLPPSAPSLAESEAASAIPDIRAKEPTSMEVFFAWEKLRLAFNALLLVIVVFMMLRAGFNPLAIVFFGEDAVLANLCYCVGPVAEGYLCWLGLPRIVVRWLVLLFGTLIGVVLAVERAAELLKRLDK